MRSVAHHEKVLTSGNQNMDPSLPPGTNLIPHGLKIQGGKERHAPEHTQQKGLGRF
jgi:hypothetical protein